jgi:tRNA pseudouridine38-40 synthase
MVRIIVGTLVEVGMGKYSADDVRQMLEARNREAAGAAARVVSSLNQIAGG